MSRRKQELLEPLTYFAKLLENDTITVNCHFLRTISGKFFPIYIKETLIKDRLINSLVNHAISYCAVRPD